MKIFILMTLFISFNVKAEDCANIVDQIEDNLGSFSEALEQNLDAELKTLNNIFNPNVGGPHVPYVLEQKRYFYDKLIPTRMDNNKIFKDRIKLIARALRKCQQEAKDCNGQVNASSRSAVKKVNKPTSTGTTKNSSKAEQK